MKESDVICKSCNGLTGRDCYNPLECAEIIVQMKRAERNDYAAEIVDGIKQEYQALQSENARLRSFVEEITRADGKYTYLDKTSVVADAYAVLNSKPESGG